MEYPIQIIKSDRKTVSIEIKRDGRIIVRAPNKMNSRDIRGFIDEKSAWIDKHMKKIKAAELEQSGTELTREDLERLAKQAAEIIPQRTEELAGLIGVDYGRITVRRQVSRWGSCTAKGNLNFNCLLMLFPTDVLDYVIIHELCHRRYMNHSKYFWAEVEKFCPDYKAHKIQLSTVGSHYINQLRKL